MKQGGEDDPVLKLRTHVYAARLYNLVEWFASNDWEVEIGKIGVEPSNSFDKLIWVHREGFGKDFSPEAKDCLSRYAFDEVTLDWGDIDDFAPRPEADVASLSHPRCRANSKALSGLLTEGATDTRRSPAAGADSERPPQDYGEPAGLPVVIGCGAGLCAVWTTDGRLDTESLDSWGDLETTAADPRSSYVVSADGRLVVIAHDRVITASWLTTTGGYTPDRRGEIELPEPVGPKPHIVTAATMLSGTIRLTITNGTVVWRLFLAPDGEIFTRPITSPPVAVGIDVLSRIVLYKPDGRQMDMGDGGETIFPGLRVRAVDAAFSGGVTVVAALGKRIRVGQPTIQVKRRSGKASWESVVITAEGIEEGSISSVTVERRLDDLEPSHLVVDVAGRPHVIALPKRARSEPAHGFGGMRL